MALVAAVAKLALFTVVTEMPPVDAEHDVYLVAAVVELTLVDAVDEMALVNYKETDITQGVHMQ